MSALTIPLLTPEQYLTIERAAEEKSEYYDGQMFAMSGGTLPHALLGASLIASVSTALRGRRCSVVSSDLRVRVSPKGPFFYPDATVFCGTAELADDYNDSLLNPTVIFEMLSPSTEAYDRGLKFSRYRAIESLQEYVLLSQSEPFIEVFTRQSEGKWLLSEFAGIDAVCRLDSIDCDLPLSAVYPHEPA